jgi:hypothetical protein
VDQIFSFFVRYLNDKKRKEKKEFLLKMSDLREMIYEGLQSVLKNKYRSLPKIVVNSDEELRKHVDKIIQDLKENMPRSKEIATYTKEEFDFIGDMSDLLYSIKQNTEEKITVPLNNTFYVHLLRIYDDLNYLLSSTN